MAGGNTALAFGAIIAGAVAIDYGVKNAKSAFSSAPATTTTSTGSSTSSSSATGSTAATGTVAGAESLAEALVGTPYEVSGHSTAIDSTIAQVKNVGTDCSGYVSDLMGPNGLGIWTTAEATPGIPTAPDILPGVGTQITLWNNSAPGAAGHVFIEFTVGGVDRWFEDAGGIGAHEMTQTEANAYLATGAYQPFHPSGY